jgi:L-fucose isomerase-like protein
VLPFDMVDFIRDARSRAAGNRSRYVSEVRDLRGRYEVVDLDDDVFVNILAVRDQMLALAVDHGLEGIAFQTFQSIIDAMGAYCIFAEGEVTERYPFALESDIHGVISAALMRRVDFDAMPVYMAEFTVRHPEDDNGVLIWHAGAPISMKHPDEQVKIGHHWILPSPLSGMTHFRLQDGPLTVARFDGDFGAYKLAVGEGKSMDGPRTLNNYVWMKVDHWPHWERTLMEGPWIHHCAMAYGHFGDALVEACKYIPGLEPVRLDHSATA